MQRYDTPEWHARIRAAYWIIGLLFGAVMTYTTRYFINGDAIGYVEIGESLRTAQWMGLANLTYSPGYPVLLGIGQIILNTNPMNELVMLRFVNFFCFVLTMGACDLVLHFVKREVIQRSVNRETLLPFSLISSLCYAMFLVASLVFIRVRLLNPDMLVFAIVLGLVAVILWIREAPGRYLKYVLLGSLTGIGYIVKSFFLPFSPVFFVLAAACAGSLRKAFPRVVVALLVMAVVSAPLIAALSSRLGRFSYGELGKHVYATIISGKGSPKHPEVLNVSPKVTRYMYSIACTRPSGFDICYWHEGLRPDINMSAHLRIIPGTMLQIVTQTPWLLLIVAWYLLAWRWGAARFGPLYPPSVFLLLLVPAVAGIAFYCLIRMEPRYIAPYLFVGFTALTVSLRYPAGDRKASRRIALLSGMLLCFFMAIVTHSLIDQSVRALRSTDRKLSYEAAFEEHVAVKNALQTRGMGSGDYIALVGSPPVYWARMAGVRIVAEVESAVDFLKSGPDAREKAIQSLRKSGIRAVVARGSAFGALASEGWSHVPGTRDYFMLLLPAATGESPGHRFKYTQGEGSA